MRWVILCALAATSVVSVGRYEAGSVTFRLAKAVLAARRTQQGVELTRLAYVFSRDLVVAEERSKILFTLLRVAPAKFKWPMRRSILQIAVEQTRLHPHRSEAWAMLANAQHVSGQRNLERYSQARCREFDRYGTTVEK